MSRSTRIRLSKMFGLTILLVLLCFPPRAAGPLAYAAADDSNPEASVPPQGLFSTCADGTQASGAIYRICMPTFPFSWNGDVVVYAHGYVAPNQPVGIPEEQLRLPDGTYIPDATTALGYAFATTSYSTNGLAVREGLTDLVDLVAIFKAAHPTTKTVYLTGASGGGLITTLAVEQYPNVFSGGLALCGPIGDFRAQVDYWGDFRVVFDYFFPGLMLDSTPISITQTLMDNWDSHYTNTILPVILNPANAITVTQLLTVTRAPYVPTDTATISQTIYSVLWYNVFATNDGIAKLGGQPFDNMLPRRVYTGSLDDDQLNAMVQRFSADQAALDSIQAYYQTAGRPRVPLVTQHTTLDEVVPYRQEDIYRARVVANGWAPRHDNLPVARYGHCNFQTADVVQSLNLLRSRVENPPPFPLFLPLVVR